MGRNLRDLRGVTTIVIEFINPIKPTGKEDRETVATNIFRRDNEDARVQQTKKDEIIIPKYQM